MRLGRLVEMDIVGYRRVLAVRTRRCGSVSRQHVDYCVLCCQLLRLALVVAWPPAQVWQTMVGPARTRQPFGSMRVVLVSLAMLLPPQVVLVECVLVVVVVVVEPVAVEAVAQVNLVRRPSV